MLLVLDTSVIITAYCGSKKGSCAKIIQMFNKKQLELATCNQTLQELKETIAKPKIKNLANFKSKDMAKFIPVYTYFTKKFDINQTKLKIQSRDKNDNIFLKLALASQADCLITLDKDLLILKSQFEIEILKPNDFVEKVRAST